MEPITMPVKPIVNGVMNLMRKIPVTDLILVEIVKHVIEIKIKDYIMRIKKELIPLEKKEED